MPLVRYLNDFLSLMSEPIRRRGGITDKYIGDAILAVWSPTFIDPGRLASEACVAALDQRARLGELTRLARDQYGLGTDHSSEIRIGIATGDIVAGSIGPAGARNYTVVGDTVNLAARLEVANKPLGTRILVDQPTRRLPMTQFCFARSARWQYLARPSTSACSRSWDFGPPAPNNSSRLPNATRPA